jgi:drug/metabolite transporter (DMT)-like permease
MGDFSWIWIPIVLAAAAAQTVRNAAQKNLTQSAGTLAATSVRFIYGLPFAAIALALIGGLSTNPWPQANATFLAWVSFGAVAQLAATAFLLAAMQQRTFIVAVAYSKTEVLQVALFSALLLGERVSGTSAAAIVVASLGVIFLSVKRGAVSEGLFGGWLSTVALLGIASGAGFGISAVGYRGAALALGPMPPWLAGAYTLVWAQAIQSISMIVYLVSRDPEALRAVTRAWRVSLLAGFTGALASFGWFTAFAMRNAADVRTLALVEVLYGYAVSRRLFKEKTSAQETFGIVLLIIGIIMISSQL